MADGGVCSSREVLQCTSHSAPNMVSEKSWHARSCEEPHELPRGLDMAVTLTIGVSMGVLSVLMVSADALIITKKFGTFEQLASEGHVWYAVFLDAAVSAAMVAFIAILVTNLFPLAGGSGLPEIKGYLNGNSIPRMFGKHGSWIRAVGSVLASASGLATGREGPLVSIGGAFGVSAAQLLAGRHFRRWVQLSHKGKHQEAVVVDENRFAEFKRSACVMGSASGLAAAFYSPLGGMLYMFEEATSTSWAPEMTFRTFVAVFVATFSSRLLLNAAGTDAHQLVIFQEDYTEIREWFWTDVPMMVLVAAVCGALSALYSACSVIFWRYRFQRPRTKVSKVVEAGCYAALSAMIMCAVPMLVSECLPLPAEDSHHEQVHRRYTCPEGYYNQLATLLLQGQEGTIKHLYARTVGHEASSEILPLALCIVVYFVLAMGIAGLAIPAGNFVPSMFMGAVVGRLMRQVVACLPFVISPPEQEASHPAFMFNGMGIVHSSQIILAQPGVYAVLGSGAFLGGFTHMTVAVVAILVEATRDIKIMAPLMLSVCVGRAVSRALLHMDFCERLMMLKGVPYLEPHCPKEFQKEGATVATCCDRVPQEAFLHPKMTAASLASVLRQFPYSTFPFVEPSERFCTGLVPRSRLERLLEAVEAAGSVAASATASVADEGFRETREDAADADVATEETVPANSARQQENEQLRPAARVALASGISPGLNLQIPGERSNLKKNTACSGSPVFIPNGISGLTEMLNLPIANTEMDEADRNALVEDGVLIEGSEESDLHLDSLVQQQGDGWLPIFSLADPVPYSVPEDMPISLVYPLFARAAAHAVVVTPKRQGVKQEHHDAGHFDDRVFGILERRHIATHHFKAITHSTNPSSDSSCRGEVRRRTEAKHQESCNV